MDKQNARMDSVIRAARLDVASSEHGWIFVGGVPDDLTDSNQRYRNAEAFRQDVLAVMNAAPGEMDSADGLAHPARIGPGLRRWNAGYGNDSLRTDFGCLLTVHSDSAFAVGVCSNPGPLDDCEDFYVENLMTLSSLVFGILGGIVPHPEYTLSIFGSRTDSFRTRVVGANDSRKFPGPRDGFEEVRFNLPETFDARSLGEDLLSHWGVDAASAKVNLDGLA